MTRLQVFVCLGALLSSNVVHGQAGPPAFDAATVKPSLAGTGGNRIGMSTETLTMSNVTLNICLKWAYDLQDSEISGPDSINSDRYDIVAKAAVPVSDQNQMKLMLRSLLVGRFRLAVHRENRDLNVYALIVAKNGPKFKQSVGEGRTTLMGKGTLVAQWAPMKALADFLSGPMQTRVVDMTGLAGLYDFKFDLMAYLPADLAPGAEPDVAGMILSGLQDQLGLRLESRKESVEVLVIDHMEKPNET